MSNQLCNRLARIIGGKGSVTNGACIIQTLRNLNVKILGRQSRSPLTLPFALSVEERDSRGRTLNLGETVILEREINPFVTELRKRGIKVTAIHNHWLFQSNPFKYIHWESIDNPVLFAQKCSCRKSGRHSAKTQPLTGNERVEPPPYEAVFSCWFNIR